jgi:hypothetical protein
LRDEQAVERVRVKRWERGDGGGVRRTNGQLDEAAFFDGGDERIRISGNPA